MDRRMAEASSSMPPLRALLVDLSGTLHIGNVATEGASEAIQKLREAGVALRWLSNTSKESKGSLLKKMQRMKLDVREEELFTSLSVVAQLVRERDLNPLYLLSKSSLEDFPAPCKRKAQDSVVVGLAPERLEYTTLNQAFRLLSPDGSKAKSHLIATHKALYYRDEDGGLSLGPGPFITALEEASGVTAEVVGKPTRAFFELALKSLTKDGIHSNNWSSVGMIGDDCRQDVGPVTKELGLYRFLVQTGKYRKGDEEHMAQNDGRPDWVGRNFAQAVEAVLLHR